MRLRPVSQPVSEPSKMSEESIRRHRERMAQEDATPPNMKVFGALIAGFLLMSWGIWHLAVMHQDHWVIDEIDHGHVENVRRFLHDHTHYHINQLDDHGDSLLHHAVESNQPAIVKILLEHGANVAVFRCPCSRARTRAHTRHTQNTHTGCWRASCARSFSFSISLSFSLSFSL